MPHSSTRLRIRRHARLTHSMAVSAAINLLAAALSVSAADPAAPAATPAAAAGEQTEPSAPLVSPAEWLKAQPAPTFAAGHTLPPLTRYGWTLPFDCRVELTERWGYALEFGGYVTDKSAAKLDDPESIESKLVALTAADPKRYPLAVICSRQLPTEVPPETWTRDAEGHLLDAKAESLDGTAWAPGMKTVYSPISPDSVWQEAGRLRAEPIAKVREKAPIAIVLNGGEYGIGVLGFAKKVWEKDPAILAAKGDTPWYDFVSANKARSELLIANAVKAVTPDRQLYIYYTTAGGTHRNRWPGWTEWFHGYEWMKPVSDLASSEYYYKHFNSGFAGDQDMLSQMLNSHGFEVINGQPLSYSWFCAGWAKDKEGKNLSGIADTTRYTGFLKSAYMTGTIGGNAGYYTYPPGGFGTPFPADQPAPWLPQMLALSRVHALFSHLEVYLRQGDLLAGVGHNKWSKDQPSYEFPTGDATARVLVRKRQGAPEWLLSAWAADGEAREVTVTIPELGEVTLLARPEASVYRAHLADGTPVLEPVDALADPAPAPAAPPSAAAP